MLHGRIASSRPPCLERGTALDDQPMVLVLLVLRCFRPYLAPYDWCTVALGLVLELAEPVEPVAPELVPLLPLAFPDWARRWSPGWR